PGDDFYRYVNDGWLKTVKIPAGYPYMNSFVQVNQRTESRLRTVIDELDGQAPTGTVEQQVYALYQSLVDQKAREEAGIAALKPLLSAISQAHSHGDIAALMGRAGYPSFMAAGVSQDAGDPERNVGIIGQGGLALPGRDYYLDAKMASLRKQYHQYVAGVFMRAGLADNEEEASHWAGQVLSLETAIARCHWTPAQARDRKAAYHPMPKGDLETYAPGFDWNAFFANNPAGDSPDIVIASDTAVKDLAVLFAKTDLDTLKHYMNFQLLNDFSPFLSSPWENAYFDFFDKKIQGVNQQRSMQERALVKTSKLLGEPLGKLYVARYFPKDAKKQIETMVDYLLAAYRQRLQNLAWMDDETRKEALAKLDGINRKIGYPDTWHDYSELALTKDDLIGNVLAIIRWHRKDDRARLKTSPRRWEWAMTPQTINAYYTSTGNEIVFPAAILQPPFFDPNADMAVNFGAIGMVIGHEIGHGFDDQGSRSDAQGRLRNWWTEASRQRFDTLTGQLVNQFNQYQPLPDLHVNGRLTLGENIGDLGGAQVSLAALKKYIHDHPDDVPASLNGFTPTQRFFLSFAQMWRAKYSKLFLRRQVLTDPHSPSEYRVNGVVQNLNDWYGAFSVQPDNALYKPEAKRIHIW
ncbi:MAG: M13 family metallopeptidase, partial [Thiohalomonadales bacterium]|nr:M13 family metallopeptidase [Thiohalomonadales bacterium]